MPETLKILGSKRKQRGRKVLQGAPGVVGVTMDRGMRNELLKRGVMKRVFTKKRRQSVDVLGIVGRGALLAVESRTTAIKRVAPLLAAGEQATNPNLDKFKAAFGTLKGLKIFGDDAVGFQREMREEWQ